MLGGLGGLSVLTGVPLTSVDHRRTDIQCGLWGLVALLAFLGDFFQCQGGVTWIPIFGVDGLAWSLLLVLAFAGGLLCSEREILACVLLGLGFLVSSPLVFGLLAGTALALLPAKDWKALCLPFAVLPACIPVDNPLSVFLLCLTILQTGWTIIDQQGASVVVPVCTGVFLLSRILVEYGHLPFVIQIALLTCCGCVAVRGCCLVFYANDLEKIMRGVVMAWYGCVVSDLLLTLISTLEGSDIFGIALQLGLGPCFLGLLVVLAVVHRQEIGLFIPFKRLLVGLGVFQGSLMPPSGGFMMVWSTLEAVYLSMSSLKPASAFVLLLLTTFQCVVFVGMMLGLLRVVLALLCPYEKEIHVEKGAYGTTLSLWGCMGGALFFLLLPKLWLFLTHALVSGPAVFPSLSWNKGLFVLAIPESTNFLVPIGVLMVMGVVLGGVFQLMRLLGVSLWTREARIVPVWKQAMPFVEGVDVYRTKTENVVRRELVLPINATASLGGGRFWVLGGGYMSYRDRLLVRCYRRSLKVLRSIKRIACYCGLRCNQQGVAWVLLLLGTGLVIGLFVGT